MTSIYANLGQSFYRMDVTKIRPFHAIYDKGSQ